MGIWVIIKNEWNGTFGCNGRRYKYRGVKVRNIMDEKGGEDQAEDTACIAYTLQTESL